MKFRITQGSVIIDGTFLTNVEVFGLLMEELEIFVCFEKEFDGNSFAVITTHVCVSGRLLMFKQPMVSLITLCSEQYSQ